MSMSWLRIQDNETSEIFVVLDFQLTESPCIHDPYGKETGVDDSGGRYYCRDCERIRKKKLELEAAIRNRRAEEINSATDWILEDMDISGSLVGSSWMMECPVSSAYEPMNQYEAMLEYA